MKRIFHPIGQGAYYSEHHEKCNIVYDCGEWKNSKLADSIVTGSFRKGSVVDVLFISHFHYDHVSKINILKNHVEIKNVVLPLLHDEDIMLLSNINRLLKNNILNLIQKPEKFFGSKTNIIYVRSSDYTESMSQGVSLINELKKSNEEKIVIDSGIPLSVDLKSEWVFIPYNYESQQRREKLKIVIEGASLDFNKITSKPVSLNDCRLSSIGIKQLKSLYDKIGDINENSMILYSGPLHTETNFYYQGNNYDSNGTNFDKKRCGSIYTGDANLNKANIANFYKDVWDNVGTIQIPHHGDKKMFGGKELNKHKYYCPISFGCKNTYGHPSNTVIMLVMSNYSYPILVTERKESVFEEIIYP